MGTKPPPFSKVEYWEDRFKTDQNAYDWLQQPPILDDAIAEALSLSSEENPRILHVGCGTSLLSFHLRRHVNDPRYIQNVDFSSEAIEWGKKREREMFGFEVDQDEDASELVANFEQPAPQLAMPMSLWSQTSLLSLESVISTCSLGAFQAIVDKSLCDAVACGSDVEVFLPYFLYMDIEATSAEANASTDFTEGQRYRIHPLHVLAIHLALVARCPGARWIALSYSEKRFPFLQWSDTSPKIKEGEIDQSIPDEMLAKGFPDPSKLWKPISRDAIASAYGGTTQGPDGVHRPASYHWLYVMERTNIELRVRGT